MILTSGSLMISLGWLLWGWAYASHSRSVPAAWTRSALLTTLAVVVVVNLLCLGVGFVVAALVSTEGPFAGQSVSSLALTLAAPVAAVLVAPRLRRLLGGADPA